MDDIISLSSGSDSDSDLEVVRCYSDDTREDARPFIRTDWVPVKPVVIDLSKLRRRRPQRCQRGSIEVVDLSLVEENESEAVCAALSISDKEDDSLHQQGECQIPPSLATERSLSLSEENSQRIESPQKCCLPPDCEALSVSEKEGNGLQLEGESEAPSPAALIVHKNISVKDPTTIDSIEKTSVLLGNKLPALEKCSSQKDSPDSIPSPFSLDSNYHCPSEIDPFSFSDESNMPELKETTFTTDLFDHLAESSCMPSKSTLTEAQRKSSVGTFSSVAGLEAVWEENLVPSSSSVSQSNTGNLTALPASDTVSPWTESQINCTPNSPGRPGSDVSKTIQTAMRATHLHSAPCPQICLSNPLSERGCQEQEGIRLHNGLGQVENRQDDSVSHMMSDFGPGMSGQELQHKQYISHIQLKKLKKQMGAVVQDLIDEEEEEEDYGPPELLCRQSLSLVYSTIEENYPEGTLQLLSDFLQPRYYPPPDIMAHLLRGILMDPHCPDVLALEAYSLLMRIQIFHPSDISSLSWDWGLLTAVMEQQDSSKRLRLDVRCMLLQYVLQILEDDFQQKLCMQKLHLSITKAMLSCEQRFTHVRDLICWLFEAVSLAVGSKENKNPKRERNENLKMVMVFQKMLVLALEVDRTPTCSSNKISQELFHTIISSQKREHRLLLFDTLESNLLKCKLLELLLDYECPQKIPVPMSLSLLLHFLQYSTLPSDPMDGSEGWRRWEELMQLIWMLLLSYEEVMKGHLRCSVTERSTYGRAPTWTMNDRLTEAMVQDAADAFLARAERDLGFSLPTHVQESLALLQEHLLDTY
ncbi:SUMO-interacting motif-containing protein 1 [Alosa pseudoharengus]|uniref:SUMO-interacting motif-containing protein 1 n=1 Tax=Alosa pseudoharengus TaxID=34774 RepID=UPI003F8930B1